MPRISRIVVKNEPAVYHVMSRTALDGFPFQEAEKDELVRLIKKISKLYFTEVLGYCVLGNHFHLLVEMYPENIISDSDIKSRYQLFYGDEKESYLPDDKLEYLKHKWTSLSEYMKEIKQTFTRYFNKRHNRRGTLWGERFKSVLVEKGETLMNCLSYIDLNPVRAGIVKRPELYRWCSLGYHMQTENKEDFLSLDFGLVQFGYKSAKERLKHYRKHVYEAGALERPDGKYVKLIDPKILKKEQRKNFEIKTYHRLRFKTRYFTDSGIIGSKEFVYQNYLVFKDMFNSKHEKKPKPVKGLTGFYSLKRLSEI